MRLTTIGARLAAELRKADLQAAGLKYAYYPAPSALNDTPAAMLFTTLATPENLGGEQVWETEIRVQLLVPSKGRLTAEINALEPLIEPITDHFAPGTDAYHLRSATESGMVHRCFPERFELSQIINYAGTDYTAIVAYFGLKYHRTPGED